MPIANFNPQEFGKNLAQQAIDVVPKDINEDNKKYIINKVYQFCVLAGNAINQDPNLSFNADQASVITQYIGEWTFHKSIDLIRSGIPNDCWDSVLQQVAFSVFEIAKQLQATGTNPNQAAEMIEKEVNASYERNIRELAQSGKIKGEDVSTILSQSNIDKMAQESQSNNISKEEENRTLKLASIALLLKTLPHNKSEKILSKLNQEEINQIRTFMNVPDLESKLDHGIAANYLLEFKKCLNFNSKSKSKSLSNQYIAPIRNLSSLYTEKEINDIVRLERIKIKDFVNYSISVNNENSVPADISPHIAKITFNYLKNKLAT